MADAIMAGAGSPSQLDSLRDVAASIPRGPVGGGKSADVTTVTTVLAVENMNCGNCMRKVESALEAVPGVTFARSNLAERRVSVISVGAGADASAFVGALEAAGYKAKVLDLAKAGGAGRDGAGRDLMRRMGVAGFAAANIMLLSVSVWSGHGGDMPQSLQTAFHWLSAMIAIPAIAYAGQPFFSSARQALRVRQVNMDVPISLGVLLATSMSIYQTMRGSEHVYFDAAVTLLFFLLVGRALDQKVRSRAASAAENLLKQRARTAQVIGADGRARTLPIETVVPGTRVQVAAGEQVPVDGRLRSAFAMVDESVLTGESKPRRAEVSEVVHAGAVALTGPIEIEASAAPGASLLDEIARMMQTAEQARGRYVRLADRAARLYAPAVHSLAALTFIGWMLTGAGVEASLTAAIAVLIITCPCAIALAVPVVQVAASSRLFRDGIVLKTADALERLADVDTIVLDKTGTLTVGSPELMAGGCLDDTGLSQAAALAAGSKHPYAQAVVRAARKRGVAPARAEGLHEVAGAGLEGMIDGRTVKLGSADFCGCGDCAKEAASLWFKQQDGPAIALPMTDPLRADSIAVVAQLKAEGYGIMVLSGDTDVSVREAAAALAISDWSGRQRPEQKIARLNALAAAGHKTLMVGDGLNDAPALAGGHASLSPSSAADISQMAADAIFQGDRLLPVKTCLSVAKAARRRALENFAIAIGYNAVFVPLAMAGHVTPLLAAIAMSASSIAVTLNALRMALIQRETIA